MEQERKTKEGKEKEIQKRQGGERKGKESMK